MNKRFSLASASVFIFVLSGQINAQVAEPAQPEANVPAVESPAPEPVPNPVQPAPQARALPVQVSQVQAAPVQASANEEDISKNHELKLDIVYALFDALKIGYEYTLSYRNALALNLQYSFSKKKPEIRTQALASYKLYVVRPKKGPSLFVETSAGYTQGYYEYTYYEYRADWDFDEKIDKKIDKKIDEKKKYDAFTVGLSGGLKFYVPRADVGLETIVGFSRPYGVYSNEDESMESMYWLPLLSASLIKRF
jgi:hypothetical protein